MEPVLEKGVDTERAWLWRGVVMEGVVTDGRGH